jgi:hypothetical protein
MTRLRTTVLSAAFGCASMTFLVLELAPRVRY